MPEPATDPTKKPVGKLPTDAQILLRRFYVMRPEVDLPPHLHELEGTWGRFIGNGAGARPINVGFPPGYVLFTTPPYPNGPPKWVPKKGNRAEGELVDPGLHDQPEMTPVGFVAPPECNQTNEHVVYIAWKQDPSMVAAKEKAATEGAKNGNGAAHEDESPRDMRRRLQLEKRQKDLDERKQRAAARRR
jgi:hypothetical protein